MEDTCTAPARKRIPFDLDPAQQVTEAPRPIRVLLVEDDPDAVELVRIGLEDSTDEFRVEWSPSLTGAMNRLAKRGVDAILLDLGLPELTGYGTYRAIEAASVPRTPIVVLTADERAHVRELSMASGASDYLVKGQTTPVHLKRALRKAVKSRSSTRCSSSTPPSETDA